MPPRRSKSPFPNHHGTSSSKKNCRSKIPAAFIITGTNTASQDLLLDQLSEKLQSVCHGRFVRVRAAEAPNLKTVLKKIIRDVTSRDPDGDGGADVAVGDDVGTETPPLRPPLTEFQGRKYLDYDLEALYAFIWHQAPPRVIVTLEDSEAFDSGLLSDLVELLQYGGLPARLTSRYTDRKAAHGVIASNSLFSLASPPLLNCSRPVS